MLKAQSTQNIFDSSVLPNRAAQAEQGGGHPASVPPSEQVRGQSSDGLPSSQAGHRADAAQCSAPDSISSPGRFDASLEALQLKQRIDFELKLNHVPNFSVSSTRDDADERY